MSLILHDDKPYASTLHGTEHGTERPKVYRSIYIYKSGQGRAVRDRTCTIHEPATRVADPVFKRTTWPSCVLRLTSKIIAATRAHAMEDAMHARTTGALRCTHRVLTEPAMEVAERVHHSRCAAQGPKDEVAASGVPALQTLHVHSPA